jgi:hypothetical protein
MAMKRLNWNMLHFSQCPKCGGDLLPADSEQQRYICENSIEKGRSKCTFSIRPIQINRITNSLRVRVY